MATPRTARRAALVLVGALGLAFAPAPAGAEEPTTAAEAAALVAARGHELEVLTEDFNEAREMLAGQQAAAQAAAAAVTEAQAAAATARESVVGVARTAFTGDSMGSFQALMTSDSAEEFVNRVTLLQAVAGHQGELLDAAAAAGEVATQAQVVADRAAAEAQQQYDAVARQQADLQAQIAGYQADYARLSTDERRAALEAAAAAHGAGEGGRASRTGREEPAAASSAPVVATSGSIQAVVDRALAQRGKPYVWAAGGPNSFDCSGLVQYAFQAAGINLPHSSRMQSSMGTPVSRADARPGDLVAFYSPVSHIGIYLGNGQMVHAPTSGDVVKVAGVDNMGATPKFNRIAN
ncbi:C40 family peptidase [Geodermatophilus obscurus]|uniref:NLP/P60 protein n=1 Tax=Geodermatophilus obscurus (strain ATCC 25078 / DSM 43160 / JCM 3152 / CCUG 61914 / KCC A-0152 / KCTC 9177 / NBRC 13315 / NRRL B-3577 / G-20) TaxID=526225 RepID=D2S6Q7_GEOOG|nr:C40 family peptidase [Geodermatophilus obscurus]ADB77399.1 NLP/P60 protein [Geodermatophilus obscurus DSM 43160]